MKIAIPMLDTPHSGGTRVLVELANGLVRRGHQCNFVLPRGTKPLPFKTEAGVIEVGPRLPYMPNARNFINAFLLRRFIPEADVVLANTWLSSFPTLWSLRRCGAVGFYFIQGDERVFFSNNLLGRLKQFLAHKSYELPLNWLTNSVWLKERLYAEFSHKAIVVNPGVDIKIFTPGNEHSYDDGNQESYTIVSVGRSLPLKGLPDLLKALKAIYAKEKIRLILISQEKLELEVPYPVQIISPRTDIQIAALYRLADVFVFPSWLEGYGLPPLEAMACGVPVVTTDCGGVRDFAVDGVNSLIVPPENPESMAEAILRLLRDPVLANQIARNGVTTAHNFTWDKFVDKTEQIFLDALAADN